MSLSQAGVAIACCQWPKTAFHSFRHTYRDALREADISTERARALGGWTAGGGAEEIYGEGLRADTLAREIQKISYPGLDLSHLYARPVEQEAAD